MVYEYYADQGGLRFVIMYKEGYKWVYLLDTALLTTYRIPARDKQKLKPYKVNSKTMAKRLRERRTRYKRLNVSFSVRALKTSIAKLEGRA